MSSSSSVERKASTAAGSRRPRVRLVVILGALFGAIVVLAAALGAGVVWTLVGAADSNPERLRSLALLYGGGALLALLALGAAAWTFLELRLARPLASLARQARTAARSRSDISIERPAGHVLDDLPEAVAELADALAATRREVLEAMAAAGDRAEQQKSWLEAILLDLSEGVIVCNRQHRVMLYNQAALRVLKTTEELGLGRSVFDVVTREPVLHALDRLERSGAGTEAGKSAPLVFAAAGGGALLDGRVTTVVGPDRQVTGYVLTFSDVSQEIDEVTRRDGLLRKATEGMRAPVANVRTAVEALFAQPDLAPEHRRAFQEIIEHESERLSEQLERLTAECRALVAGPWPMAEIFSSDLLACVARNLGRRRGIEVTLVGLPLWLRGDSHQLALLIEHLVERLHEYAGARSFDVEPKLGDRRIYLDVLWSGEPVPPQVIDDWLAAPLESSLGPSTVREVLERHGSEIWSQRHRPGGALLRVPLPGPARPQVPRPSETLPPRPEFYDFDLKEQREGVERLGERPLRELSYVVFDTETTGLDPSGGDEIVSIAGVRIVNGRLLTAETFERLVNPRRSVPRRSTRFHGITDEMVRDKPPIETVLEQFKRFVGEAVLVAHNAAFDMKFLRLKETSANVNFDNPVLDTLLLSVFLHEEMWDHTLDAVAERFHVDVAGRHTARGDAMVTAAVFVQMLDLLEARGVTTLDEAVAAAQRALETRKLEAES